MQVSIFLIGLAFVINIIKFKRNIKENAPAPFLGASERLPYFSAAADLWPNPHRAERAPARAQMCGQSLSEIYNPYQMTWVSLSPLLAEVPLIQKIPGISRLVDAQ
jgi:hypothetical protein